VCLEVGKTASRGKTKRGNRGKNGPKTAKNPPPERNQVQIRSFSAACLVVPQMQHNEDRALAPEGIFTLYPAVH
jgi:hypothetical protein